MPIIVGLNLALLFLVAISGDLAERSWWTMLIAYLPVFPFLVPTLFIVALCILTRQVWMAGFHIAGFMAAVLVLVPFGSPKVGVPFFGASADVKTIRVMTFNVQLGLGGAEGARKVIQAQKPDVFCLQEARGDEIETQIREELPGYEIRWDGAMVIGSRLPITEYRTHDLPHGGKWRPIQDVTVDWEGYPVRVLNLHLNPCFADKYLLEDPSKLPEHMATLSYEQGEQTEAILRLVPGTAPIVCGDFNMPPRGGNYRNLRKVMHDAFVEAGEGLGLTIPARFPMERLDQIFLAYGWKTERSWIPREIASDHLPLLADVYPFTPEE
ncbi:MAG: endonuclease/exonuclease/phosphatase family protein [Fimbriimonas sp.]